MHELRERTSKLDRLTQVDIYRSRIFSRSQGTPRPQNGSWVSPVAEVRLYHCETQASGLSIRYQKAGDAGVGLSRRRRSGGPKCGATCLERTDRGGT